MTSQACPKCFRSYNHDHYATCPHCGGRGLSTARSKGKEEPNTLKEPNDRRSLFIIVLVLTVVVAGAVLGYRSCSRRSERRALIARVGNWLETYEKCVTAARPLVPALEGSGDKVEPDWFDRAQKLDEQLRCSRVDERIIRSVRTYVATHRLKGKGAESQLWAAVLSGLSVHLALRNRVSSAVAYQRALQQYKASLGAKGAKRIRPPERPTKAGSTAAAMNALARAKEAVFRARFGGK